MAKRTLGLGQAAKERKKQKVKSIGKKEKQKDTKLEESPKPQSNEITVELGEEVDPDDEIAQLRALWATYLESERDNELILNGIVHECDRLLRKKEEQERLPADFYGIYALALADLAVFHTDDETDGKVKDYFDAALERVEIGEQEYPNSIELKFAKSKISISRIPLEYLVQLDSKSHNDDLNVKIDDIIDEALSKYEEAEDSVKVLENYAMMNSSVFDILVSFDDLLDVVQNFGKQSLAVDGLDSDAEDDDDQENELPEKHPLYKIERSIPRYLEWTTRHAEIFHELLSKGMKNLLSKDVELLNKEEQKKIDFYKSVSHKVGQLFLQAAERPSKVFTTITYESDIEDDTTIEGLSARDAQKQAIKSLKEAVRYLKKAEDDEDPQTWVDVAEAVVDLGNVYDYESGEQEEAYKVAEERLRRANNATNGKYQKILDNLLVRDE